MRRPRNAAASSRYMAGKLIMGRRFPSGHQAECSLFLTVTPSRDSLRPSKNTASTAPKATKKQRVRRWHSATGFFSLCPPAETPLGRLDYHKASKLLQAINRAKPEKSLASALPFSPAKRQDRFSRGRGRTAGPPPFLRPKYAAFQRSAACAARPRANHVNRSRAIPSISLSSAFHRGGSPIFQ